MRPTLIAFAALISTRGLLNAVLPLDSNPAPEPAPAPAADWNSNVCKTCQDKIGTEGTCGLIGEDDQCITDLCKSISECGECGANCDEDFKVGGAGIPADAPPDPTIPECDTCFAELNSSGCDQFPVIDVEGCFFDTCANSEACNICGGSCDVYAKRR